MNKTITKVSRSCYKLVAKNCFLMQARLALRGKNEQRQIARNGTLYLYGKFYEVLLQSIQKPTKNVQRRQGQAVLLEVISHFLISAISRPRNNKNQSILSNLVLQSLQVLPFIRNKHAVFYQLMLLEELVTNHKGNMKFFIQANGLQSLNLFLNSEKASLVKKVKSIEAKVTVFMQKQQSVYAVRHQLTLPIAGTSNQIKETPVHGDTHYYSIDTSSCSPSSQETDEQLSKVLIARQDFREQSKKLDKILEERKVKKEPDFYASYQEEDNKGNILKKIANILFY